jgi:SAM-dependent methyltransferase
MMREMESGAPTTPWWHGFFDETYEHFGLADRDARRAERRTAFLTEVLRLAPGSLLFDQCCGVGRVSLPLARRGVRVIGVDLSRAYVERARRSAEQAGVSAEFHLGDALSFTAAQACDAAINWFTSLGYHEDDEVNIGMLRRAFESLRPGGRFAVDYQNVPRVCGEFRERMFHYADPADPDGGLVLEEPRADFRRGMIDSTWTFIHRDGRRERRVVSTRMYMPHEIVGLLRRCGFQEIELYGSVEGEPLGFESPRCIAVAQRP